MLRFHVAGGRLRGIIRTSWASLLASLSWRRGSDGAVPSQVFTGRASLLASRLAIKGSDGAVPSQVFTGRASLWRAVLRSEARTEPRPPRSSFEQPGKAMR